MVGRREGARRVGGPQSGEEGPHAGNAGPEGEPTRWGLNLDKEEARRVLARRVGSKKGAGQKGGGPRGGPKGGDPEGPNAQLGWAMAPILGHNSTRRPTERGFQREQKRSKLGGEKSAKFWAVQGRGVPGRGVFQERRVQGRGRSGECRPRVQGAPRNENTTPRHRESSTHTHTRIQILVNWPKRNMARPWPTPRMLLFRPCRVATSRNRFLSR